MKFKFVRKLKPEASKRQFGKSPMRHCLCYFSIVLGRIKCNFVEPNFQAYGCFEGKNSVSDRLCFELLSLFLDPCNLKLILTIIIRINCFRSHFGLALISMRGITLSNLLLLPSSSFFALQVIWDWLQLKHIFYFESSQLNEFSTDLQYFGL